MPDNAECTITGCSDARCAPDDVCDVAPVARRGHAGAAELGTTQAGLACGTLIAHVKFNSVSSNRDISPQAGGVQGSAPIELLFVLENVAQFSL